VTLKTNDASNSALPSRGKMKKIKKKSV